MTKPKKPGPPKKGADPKRLHIDDVDEALDRLLGKRPKPEDAGEPLAGRPDEEPPEGEPEK